MASLDVSKARASFPALQSGFIFADNAGGSQAARGVVDRISDYLLNTNVQLGADYSVSVVSTERVASGPDVAVKLFNASSPSEIVYGSSSTLNLENLARGLEPTIEAGDEFIVTGEHEANTGPWKKLAARRGGVIKFWHPVPTSPNNPYSVATRIEDLLPLITVRTRIVAISACSNILGSIVPVKEVVQAVREDAAAKGAMNVEVSVDCVAYAPHRRIDVRDWDVDYCVFSWYKVYGPHCSAMYVRSKALQTSVTSIAHHFLPVGSTAYKLQPGGPGYELVYGTTGVLPYLISLVPPPTKVASSEDPTIAHLDAAFSAIAAHEQELLKPLLGFLTAPEQIERGVRIVGTEQIGLSRVPTVSFVVVGPKAKRSQDIVEVFDKKGRVGIRWGHFYAYTLIDHLEPKLDTTDGVVRISLVHYNTVEEVQRIVEILKEALL
ncbi:PLP-dependent transferase [Pleurotus eryngii]|uniref:PLP-dependent transferase n=1 Tax=Pleurotus eryngii TaxID=5323 RepID=A0A9P5ZWZ7_PLEER|nr:PLP-dependent transferase [Pleurotus eryngii]